MPPPDRSLVRLSAALSAQLRSAGEAERERCAAALASWQPSRERVSSLAHYLDHRASVAVPNGTVTPVNPADPDQILNGWQTARLNAVSDATISLRPADAARVVLLDLAVRQLADGVALVPAAEAEVARSLASIIHERFGGKTLEVRIPPVTAVQLTSLGAGPQHSRGTPPNVIEMDAATWVRLGLGFASWTQVRARVSASGAHVDDLAAMLPIYPRPA